MANYGKWIGGGIGWVLGGPIGALLGYLFGSMFDSLSKGEFEYYQHRKRFYRSGHKSNTPQTQHGGDFTISLLILTAAVMRADKRVLKSELNYVKSFLISQFGTVQAAQFVLMLRDILKQDIDTQGVSKQIARYMDYSSKLQLLHYLFGIVLADGHSHSEEILVVETIANYLGISSADYTSIRAMFIKDNQNNYAILNISPQASDEEVKKSIQTNGSQTSPPRQGCTLDQIFRKRQREISKKLMKHTAPSKLKGE